jgi:hypothetical protein
MEAQGILSLKVQRRRRIEKGKGCGSEADRVNPKERCHRSGIF